MTQRHRSLLTISLVLLGPLSCQVAGAQVGPSSANIARPKPPRKPAARPKKPRAGTPVVRVRTVEEPRRRVVKVARPAARPHAAPVQTVSQERLTAVRQWQSREAKALELAAKLAAQLPAPALDLVQSPVAPMAPGSAEAEVTYRQRVTLRFVREDGEPFLTQMVRASGDAPGVAREANRIELDGPRLGTDAGPVQLELPAEWAFVNGEDARLSLGTFPGEETRMDLPPKIAPPSAPPTVEPLLFSNEEARRMARSGVARPAPLAAKPAAGYPTPAVFAAQGLVKLTEARRVIDRALPASGAPNLAARKRSWQELERGVALLNQAETLFQWARAGLAGLERANPQSVLKEEYTLNYSGLRAALDLAQTRRLAYRSEAEWWRAAAEEPGNPDRGLAVKLLRESAALVSRSPELTAQAERYTKVSQDEALLQARIRAGEFNSRAIPRVQITHHLVKNVQVRRTVVNLRLAERELMAGDVVTVGGDTGRTVRFEAPKDGYWNALVPRALVKPGDMLRIVRKTETSELEGSVTLQKLDPYNDAANILSRSPMRLTVLRSFTIAPVSEGTVAMFEELAPVDRDGAKLREERKAAVKASTMGADGSWWVTASATPASFRLRTSPYPDGDMRSRSVGDRIESFARKVLKRDERNRRLLERVIVDGVRLEAPSAGQVAGVRVGATDRVVEDALGGRVPPTGTVVYLNGGLEVTLRDGAVSAIEIRRDLQALLGKPVPDASAGQVTSLDYDANRLRIRTGSSFQPPVGAELLVMVSGKTLPVERDGDQFRAVVLDTTNSDVVCKLVRKDKRGKVVGDAGRDVITALPPAESFAVSVRPPGLGD